MARMIIALFIGIWVARYLGPAQFGKLNYAQALVALFATVAGLGLPNIIINELVRVPERTHDILGTSFLLSMGAAIVTFLLVSTATWIIPTNDAAIQRLIYAFAFVPVFSSFDVITYWFQSQLRSKYAVLAQTPSLAVAAPTRAGLILMQAPLLAFAWVYVLEGLLNSIGLVTAYHWAKQSVRNWRFDARLARTLLREGFPLMLAGLAVTVYMRSDQIMLAQMLGPEPTGLYSAAVRISEMWYFVPLTLIASLHPVITAAKNRSESDYLRTLQTTLSLVTGISLTVAIPMTFASGWVMTLLYGAEYAGAGPILAVHIWAGLPATVGSVTTLWLINENRASISLYRTVVGATVNILLNLLLIPIYGAIGAAVATVIAANFLCLSIPRDKSVYACVVCHANQSPAISKAIRICQAQNAYCLTDIKLYLLAPPSIG